MRPVTARTIALIILLSAFPALAQQQGYVPSQGVAHAVAGLISIQDLAQQARDNIVAVDQQLQVENAQLKALVKKYQDNAACKNAIPSEKP